MFQTNSSKNAGGLGFLVNDTWEKWVLRYGHFGDILGFFGDRMANLDLIDFKIGLCIKVNINPGQNKFEVHV